MRHGEHAEDERLVAAANGGDADAFAALYERHKDWAHRVALRFTGDASDAADVVQEVFLYWLGKFPGFRLTARVTTFLYPALLHESRAARGRRGRFTSDEEALRALPEPREGETPGGRAELLAALARLPEAQREVLLLRYVDGLDGAEIAAALDVPPGTVKSRAHHGLRTLRGDSRARRALGATESENE